jgi:hypothetical protein
MNTELYDGIFIGAVGACIVQSAIYACMRCVQRYKNNARKKENDNNINRIRLDIDNFCGIPKDATGDRYNMYLDAYNNYVREAFQEYILENVDTWWKTYENECRRRLIPVAKEFKKQMYVDPVRPEGAWSTEWYVYVKNETYSVKGRLINPVFYEINIELTIINKTIRGDINGNQIQTSN